MSVNQKTRGLEFSVSGLRLYTEPLPEPRPHEVLVAPARPPSLPFIAGPPRAARKGRLFEARQSPLQRTRTAPALPGVASASGRSDLPSASPRSDPGPALPLRRLDSRREPRHVLETASSAVFANSNEPDVRLTSSAPATSRPSTVAASSVADSLRAAFTRIDSLEFDATMRAMQLRAEVDRALAAARQLPPRLEARDAAFAAEMSSIDERLTRLEKARSIP
eukprot:TRINITY_DN1897_c1_g1_i1.p1 TRINITY_DN1897_c1_g1~~TRINITY_DN1897_c1_g1_i1.p1  ORF type:complete len:222 (+),score=55.48 TRINITY_DN1897_c1_g1_i1:754-1419(+)